MDALSPLVARHLTVGCSTVYMVDARGDWPALVETSAATSTLAVELSALGEEELPRLVDFLQGDPPMPFHYVSVHAPSKTSRGASATASLGEFVGVVEDVLHAAWYRASPQELSRRAGALRT